MHRPSWSIDNRDTCWPLITHASLSFSSMNSHSRRPALTQADIARTIRAAKQAGAAEVELQIAGSKILIRLDPSTGQDEALEDQTKIVL
jgi:hypothetical protein